MEVIWGGNAGVIALHSAFGRRDHGDPIPENPVRTSNLGMRAAIMRRERSGPPLSTFSVVVAWEGSFPQGGVESVLCESLPGQGGSRAWRGIAEAPGAGPQITRAKTGKGGPITLVLGHCRRGGMAHRLRPGCLATRLGGAAPVRAVRGWGAGAYGALQVSNIVQPSP